MTSGPRQQSAALDPIEAHLAFLLNSGAVVSQVALQCFDVCITITSPCHYNKSLSCWYVYSSYRELGADDKFFLVELLSGPSDPRPHVESYGSAACPALLASLVCDTGWLPRALDGARSAMELAAVATELRMHTLGADFCTLH